MDATPPSRLKFFHPLEYCPPIDCKLFHQEGTKPICFYDYFFSVRLVWMTLKVILEGS
jgi:hypothetical protein